MPTQPAQWFVDQRVIFAYAYGDLTNDEMAQHNERMIELLDSADPLVHVILVTHPETHLPKPSIAAGRRILSFIGHKNLGWNIVVHNPYTIMAKMSILLAKISRARYRQFDNVDVAINFLKEIDRTVDWNTADISLLKVLESYPPNAPNSV
jgi:hypothetical protein